MPTIGSPLNFLPVAALPAASSQPNAVLAQGGKLWWSDGASWFDLGATGSGGTSNFQVVTASQELAAGSRVLAALATGASDPHWDSVTSLLRFNGVNGSTTITDDKGIVWTASNGAQITTTGARTGSGCANFPSVNSLISSASNAGFALPGDFTIEFDVFIPSNQTSGLILYQTGQGNGGLRIAFSTSNRPMLMSLVAGDVGTIFLTSSVSLTTNTWARLAVSRVGTTTRMFIDGALVGSATDARSYTATSAVVGNNGSANQGFIGRLDNARLTNGIGRHTTAYTVSTDEYPSSSGVSSTEFALPASVTAGDHFFFANAASSLASAVIDPGSSRTIEGLAQGQKRTVQAGEWIQLAARTSTQFEVVNSSADGGGGSPGGTNGQIQYNATGSFAGMANVTHENGRIVHSDYEEFALQSAAVATPSAGRGRIYMRQRAGRVTLETIGPSGIDNAVQPALFNNSVILYTPNTTTSISAQGLSATTAATLSHPALATTSLAASIYRTRCQTSTTAGNAAGIRHSVATRGRGNATFVGGFYHHVRFCSGALALAGGQAFAGLSSSVAALAGEPSALADAFGLCKDTADTQWQFVRRTGTGAAQKVALTTPLTYAANQVIDVILFCAPSGAGIGAVVRSFNNVGVATTHLDTTYTDNIPAADTLLAGRIDIRNGASAAAADIEMVRMYTDSDF